jgi:hypothetical protein
VTEPGWTNDNKQKNQQNKNELVHVKLQTLLMNGWTAGLMRMLQSLIINQIMMMIFE